ncbi:MAG: ribosome biogenesis GTPase Der, partial [Candidatus Azotimanducaceae bacterium WSBS_2022_MAG_OTU7]
ERAIFNHQPPLVNGRRIKLRYAHLGGNNPPIIVVHGNQTEKVPEAYKRYLMHQFIDALKLKGTPLRMEFRTAENPFKDRKNKLTKGQLASRKRMMTHIKKDKKVKKSKKR